MCSKRVYWWFGTRVVWNRSSLRQLTPPLRLLEEVVPWWRGRCSRLKPGSVLISLGGLRQVFCRCSGSSLGEGADISAGNYKKGSSRTRVSTNVTMVPAMWVKIELTGRKINDNVGNFSGKNSYTNWLFYPPPERVRGEIVDWGPSFCPSVLASMHAWGRACVR